MTSEYALLSKWTQNRGVSSNQKKSSDLLKVQWQSQIKAKKISKFRLSLYQVVTFLFCHSLGAIFSHPLQCMKF